MLGRIPPAQCGHVSFRSDYDGGFGRQSAFYKETQLENIRKFMSLIGEHKSAALVKELSIKRFIFNPTSFIGPNAFASAENLVLEDVNPVAFFKRMKALESGPSVKPPLPNVKDIVTTNVGFKNAIPGCPKTESIMVKGATTIDIIGKAFLGERIHMTFGYRRIDVEPVVKECFLFKNVRSITFSLECALMWPYSLARIQT